MLDGTDLIKLIKKACMDTIIDYQLSDVIIGKVIKDNPLSIAINQKLLLDKDDLILTKAVIDWTEKIEINWVTSTESAPESHSHSLNGEYEIKHKNALRINDKVILIKKLGGQQYIVLDKMESA